MRGSKFKSQDRQELEEEAWDDAQYMLSTWLVKRRKDLGLSQEVLQDISGIGRQHISDVENMKLGLSFANVYKLVKALKCEIIIKEKED
jgi:transcriptional regulator with XRE-family HTH domain